MRLYGIRHDEVLQTVESPDNRDKEGHKNVAYKTFPDRFSNLPLKVIYVIEDDVKVITTYPLKKSYRKGNKGDEGYLR